METSWRLLDTYPTKALAHGKRADEQNHSQSQRTQDNHKRTVHNLTHGDGRNGGHILSLCVLLSHSVALTRAEQCACHHQQSGNDKRQSRTQHLCGQYIQPGIRLHGRFGIFDPPPDIFLKTRRQRRRRTCDAQDLAEFCIFGIHISFIGFGRWEILSTARNLPFLSCRAIRLMVNFTSSSQRRSRALGLMGWQRRLGWPLGWQSCSGCKGLKD